MKRLLIVGLLLLNSCYRDLEPALGPMTLVFDNDLAAHPGYQVKYDITDIKVKRDDGLTYHDGHTHSIDSSNKSIQSIQLDSLSAGGYVQLIFAVESLNVTGPTNHQVDSTTVSLSMPRTPVRPDHHPVVYVKLDINKLNTSVQAAFTVDRTEEN